MLCFGVICLISLLAYLLITNGSYEARGTDVEEVAAKELDKKPITLESIVDSVNISVSSQGFVIALFPIYASMSNTARPRVIYSVTFALLFTISVYSLLSFLSIAYFGINNIQP